MLFAFFFQAPKWKFDNNDDELIAWLIAAEVWGPVRWDDAASLKKTAIVL